MNNGTAQAIVGSNLYAGLLKNMEGGDPSSKMIFGVMAKKISGDTYFIEILEKTSTGVIINTAPVQMDIPDWKNLLEQFMGSWDIAAIWYVESTELATKKNPVPPSISIVNLHSGLKEEMGQNSTAKNVNGVFAYCGPYSTGGKLDEYKIIQFQKGPTGDVMSSSFFLGDWSKIQTTLSLSENLEIALLMTTPITPAPPAPPPPTVINPDWLSGSTNNPWEAKWDWATVPADAFAVEVPISTTGTVSKWKLVKRIGGQIIPQYEVPAIYKPANSQELKDQFQLNSATSQGKFVILGKFNDKEIWIYQQ